MDVQRRARFAWLRLSELIVSDGLHVPFMIPPSERELDQKCQL